MKNNKEIVIVVDFVRTNYFLRKVRDHCHLTGKKKRTISKEM